tara:strand:+ start:11354 stop:11704 length:351 start_codon:yes stop_codon:yes gene_type:complete
MSSMKKLGEDLLLVVQGLGHVPAMKNKKRIFNGRLITDPKCQKWMASCVSSIVSQLHAASRTSDEETWTDASLQSAIALLPPDDNWKNLPVIQIEAERVPKGQEGALIRLERISPQ